MLKVEIATDNDAFQPDQNIELMRILRSIADNLECGLRADSLVRLYDINGNHVGYLELTKERKALDL